MFADDRSVGIRGVELIGRSSSCDIGEVEGGRREEGHLELR